MYIKSILKRGKEHANFCQDAIFHYENEEILVACVCDGCSEVEDSHFASNLFVKVLKKELIELLNKESQRTQSLLNSDHYCEEELETVEFSENILYSFFQKTLKIKQELSLTANDLSSTFIFMFYNKKKDEGIIYMFGDGVLQINEEYIIIDHDNKPRYFTLDWQELTGDIIPFTAFIKQYPQKWKFSNLQNVVISTDGILTFQNNNINPDYAIDFLITDETLNGKSIISQKSFYDKKYNVLTFNGWSHNDDLGLIRIVK